MGRDRIILAALLIAALIVGLALLLDWLAIKAIGEATDDGCGCGPDYCEACVEYAGNVEADRVEHVERGER